MSMFGRGVAQAAAADARAAVMRGHRAVGTGRIEVSVEGSALELTLKHWRDKPTASLAEAEVVELISRLETALPRLKANTKLAREADEDFSDLA